MTGLTVSLVAPAVWGVERERVYERLTEDTRRVTDAVVRTMHDQHVGVSLELAAELAPLFLGAGAHLHGVWRAVVDRLAKELTPGRGSRTGLIFHNVPAYSLLRLAIPLVDAACRRQGAGLLFSDDPRVKGVSAEVYREYARNLSNALHELAAAETADLFWRNRALALNGLADPTRDHHSLPEMDDTALAMLMRLNPAAQLSAARSRQLQPEAVSSPIRDVHMLKEGGIDGIRLTHRVEEMDRMTPSEFINHKTIFADRLINSGYFAYRRRPKRESRQDAVFAAVLPGGIWSQPQVDLLKSCWFSLTARLAELLSSKGLGRSAFSWTEGDSLGRVRSRAFPIHDTPPTRRGGNTVFKQAFLTAMGWLPFFLDRRDRYQEVEGDYSAENLLDWSAAAWRTGRKVLAAPNGFAYTHLMMFLPLADDASRPPSLAEVTRRTAGLGDPNPGVTLLPREWDDWERFAYLDRAGYHTLFRSQPQSLDEMADALVGLWLNQLSGELWRG